MTLTNYLRSGVAAIAGASALALTFTGLAQAGIADEPDRALFARMQISNTLIADNGLSNKHSEQYLPPREIADKLMKDIVAGLASPKDKNSFVAYTRAESGWWFLRCCRYCSS